MIGVGERLGERLMIGLTIFSIGYYVNDWVIMVNDWVNDGLMMGYGFLKLIFFYLPLVYDQ